MTYQATKATTLAGSHKVIIGSQIGLNDLHFSLRHLEMVFEGERSKADIDLWNHG
jgi:hypothetical protein